MRYGHKNTHTHFMCMRYRHKHIHTHFMCMRYGHKHTHTHFMCMRYGHKHSHTHFMCMHYEDEKRTCTHIKSPLGMTVREYRNAGQRPVHEASLLKALQRAYSYLLAFGSETKTAHIDTHACKLKDWRETLLNVLGKFPK